MTQSTFTNFKYQVDKISLRNRRGVTVTFDYNGEPVKRILVFKEKEGVSYVENAKRVIEREYRNGQLEKYAKKYVRHNNKSGKSPVMPILVGTLAVAALALTGVVTYKVFTSNGGDSPTPGPTPTPTGYYQVDFDSNGGSSVASQLIEEGGKATEPTTTKEGYTFVDWYKKGTTEPYNFNDQVTANVSLVAQWNVRTYDITFTTGGGSWSDGTGTADKTIKTEYDHIPSPGATPEKNGYVFTGWSPELQPATVKTSYTAKWEEVPSPAGYHVVEFDTDGGTHVPSQHIKDGDPAITPGERATTKDGYTFDGWHDEDGNTWNFATPITEDTKIYAYWNINKYNVTFNPNEGTWETSGSTEPLTIGHDYGATPNPGDTLARDGYTFIGWSPEFAPVTSDITYIAQWALTSYHTVTFDTQGGTSVAAKQVAHGDPVEDPGEGATTKDGYTFDGWHDEDGNTWNFATPITADTTIYAHWNINTFNITFDPDGGTWSDTDTDSKVIPTNYGEMPDLGELTVSKDGYTFVGWSEELKPATADATYTAQWQAQTKAVSIDPNGGTFIDESMDVKTIDVDYGTTWEQVKADYPNIEIDDEALPEGTTGYTYTYYNGEEWKEISDDYIITSNLSIKVIYTAKTAESFVNDSWEVFTSYLNGKDFAAITATTAPYYNEYHEHGDTFVGLTRTLTVNGMPYQVRVIGENGENGGGLFTFEFVETLNLETPYSLNSDNNSYKDSYIHNFLNKSLYFSLPSSLQSAIRMKDASYYDAVEETSVRFSARLFVLSAAELGCGDTFPDGTSTEYENEAYSYYANGGSRIKKNLAGEAINYWTRSADRTGSLETAWNVNPTGVLGDTNGQSVATDSAMYIAPVFNVF